MHLRYWLVSPRWFDSAIVLSIQFVKRWLKSADTIALMIVIGALGFVVVAGYFIAVNFWLASR